MINTKTGRDESILHDVDCMRMGTVCECAKRASFYPERLLTRAGVGDVIAIRGESDSDSTYRMVMDDCHLGDELVSRYNAQPALLDALREAEDAMVGALWTVEAAVKAGAVTFASVDNPSVNLKYQINSVRAAIARVEGK